MRFLIIGLLLFLTFIFTLSLSAQWQECTNVPSKNLEVLRVHSDILYAGTGRGRVFRSTDNGNTWVDLGRVKGSNSISDLVVSDNYIIAGNQKGIFISSDMGITWEDKSNDLENKDIRNIAVKDNYIFAGTFYFASIYSGLYISSNRGDTWIEVNDLSNKDIQAITVKDEYIFVGTYTEGMFRSSDNGMSWIKLMDGMIISFTVSGDNIYAGKKGAVYRSTNNGDSWEELIFISAVNQIENFNASNNLVLAGVPYHWGVYVSTDNGIVWSKQNDGLPSDLSLSGGTLAINEGFAFIAAIDFEATYQKLYRRPLSDFTTSVADNIKSVFVSPNPASDYINVEGINLGDKVEIHCVLGIKQIEQIYNGSIDISQLSPGMYFLKLYTMSGEVLVEKVMVGF